MATPKLGLADKDVQKLKEIIDQPINLELSRILWDARDAYRWRTIMSDNVNETTGGLIPELPNSAQGEAERRKAVEALKKRWTRSHHLSGYESLPLEGSRTPLPERRVFLKVRLAGGRDGYVDAADVSAVVPETRELHLKGRNRPLALESSEEAGRVVTWLESQTVVVTPGPSRGMTTYAYQLDHTIYQQNLKAQAAGTDISSIPPYNPNGETPSGYAGVKASFARWAKSCGTVPRSSLPPAPTPVTGIPAPGSSWGDPPADRWRGWVELKTAVEIVLAAKAEDEKDKAFVPPFGTAARWKEAGDRIEMLYKNYLNWADQMGLAPRPSSKAEMFLNRMERAVKIGRELENTQQMDRAWVDASGALLVIAREAGEFLGPMNPERERRAGESSEKSCCPETIRPTSFKMEIVDELTKDCVPVGLNAVADPEAVRKAVEARYGPIGPDHLVRLQPTPDGLMVVPEPISDREPEPKPPAPLGEASGGEGQEGAGKGIPGVEIPSMNWWKLDDPVPTPSPGFRGYQVPFGVAFRNEWGEGWNGPKETKALPVEDLLAGVEYEEVPAPEKPWDPPEGVYYDIAGKRWVRVNHAVAAKAEEPSEGEGDPEKVQVVDTNVPAPGISTSQDVPVKAPEPSPIDAGPVNPEDTARMNAYLKRRGYT